MPISENIRHATAGLPVAYLTSSCWQQAAAELIGLPLHPYSQPKYVTCLDIGPWGALYTEGWDRQVRLTREEGKALKREINTQWIYPPAADRNAAFAIARPDYVTVA